MRQNTLSPRRSGEPPLFAAQKKAGVLWNSAPAPDLKKACFFIEPQEKGSFRLPNLQVFHSVWVRRFPKGDRKALWSRPQARNLSHPQACLHNLQKRRGKILCQQSGRRGRSPSDFPLYPKALPAEDWLLHCPAATPFAAFHGCFCHPALRIRFPQRFFCKNFMLPLRCPDADLTRIRYLHCR